MTTLVQTRRSQRGWFWPGNLKVHCSEQCSSFCAQVTKVQEKNKSHVAIHLCIPSDTSGSRKALRKWGTG